MAKAALPANHISQKNKSRAATALANKFAVIDSWLKSGIPWQTDSTDVPIFDKDGERVLVPLPNSIEYFCDWEGIVTWVGDEPPYENAHEVPLARIARATINEKTKEYEAIKSSIREKIKLLKARATLQIEKGNKQSIIEKLRSELEFRNKLIAQQEQEVIRFRRQAAASAKELGDKTNEFLNNEREYQTNIAQLEATNAELRKSLTKVKPMAST